MSTHNICFYKENCEIFFADQGELIVQGPVVQNIVNKLVSDQNVTCSSKYNIFGIIGIFTKKNMSSFCKCKRLGLNHIFSANI